MAKCLQAILVLCGRLLLSGMGYLAAATAQTSASSHLDAMKSMYRREPPQPIANQPLVDLGRELFFDPAIVRIRENRLRHLPSAATRLGGDGSRRARTIPASSPRAGRSR